MLSTLGNAIAHAAWAMQTTSEPAAGICMQYILLTTTGCNLQLPVSQFYQQQTMYPGHMVRHQHSPMAQANTKCRRQPRKQHATSQLSLLSHYLGQQQPSLVTSSTETPQNPAHVLARPTEQLSMVGCGGCLQESTAGTAGQTAGLID